MNRIRQPYRELLIYALLGMVTLATYWPVLHHDFLRYDDITYVTFNPSVLGGLSWQAVGWAFQTGYASNWHPITWLSHMLDVQLFGVHPAWHHLTNLLLHTANTLLLFLLLRSTSGRPWSSLWVAAVFALHPLHVESVAWVAERKDVLSTFFFMLTLLAYSKYAATRKELEGRKPTPEESAKSGVRSPKLGTVNSEGTGGGGGARRWRWTR